MNNLFQVHVWQPRFFPLLFTHAVSQVLYITGASRIFQCLKGQVRTFVYRYEEVCRFEARSSIAYCQSYRGDSTALGNGDWLNSGVNIGCSYFSSGGFHVELQKRAYPSEIVGAIGRYGLDLTFAKTA